MIKTLQNIFKIEELKNRIIYTLILLAIFRLGSYIPLPGIDTGVLQQLFQRQQSGGILDLLNNFVGGAFSRGAIFALGIMPYISASIFMQLLSAALPSLQKIAKEGESGQRKINQYTRYLTIGITAFQAAAYIFNMKNQYGPAIIMDQTLFTVITIFVLTAGTMFMVWLGERITDNGIGNGVSMIIAIGILADLPISLLGQIWDSGDAWYSPSWPIAPMNFYIELIALALVTVAVILLTQGTRKIPVNYAKRVQGSKMMGGTMMQNVRQYIPLKLNAAGVMPIIFAQAIMFIPAQIAQLFPADSAMSSLANSTMNFTSIGYNVVFVLLIIVFTYFYTAIAVNPNDIADQMKRNGGFIPGVKPGRPTSEYIDAVMTRITLPGAIFLAFIAIMPAIATSVGVPSQFAQFFGGTSLLIMIGVVLDTLQQIEGYLLMRHYDGLISGGGKIRGRNPQINPSF